VVLAVKPFNKNGSTVPEPEPFLFFGRWRNTGGAYLRSSPEPTNTRERELGRSRIELRWPRTHGVSAAKAYRRREVEDTELRQMRHDGVSTRTETWDTARSPILEGYTRDPRDNAARPRWRRRIEEDATKIHDALTLVDDLGLPCMHSTSNIYAFLVAHVAVPSLL